MDIFIDLLTFNKIRQWHEHGDRCPSCSRRTSGRRFWDLVLCSVCNFRLARVAKN